MAEPRKIAKPQLFSAIGLPGVKRSGEYVQEEFVRELMRPRGLRVYREMSDNDPIIGALMNLIGGLFRTIDWDTEPADKDSPEDETASDFINDCLEDMEPSLREMIPETIDMFPFGFSLAELVYKRRDDGKIGWQEWRFLAPETLDRWEWDDATGQAITFVQRPPSDYSERFIPLEKCLHLRTTRRKGNPEGKSILRNAWRSWYYKTRLEEIEAIGCERDLAGLPVIEIPLKYMDANASPGDKQFYEEAKKLVRNVRRDEHEGLVLPSNVDANGNKLVDFKLLTTGGSRAIDIGKVIERHDSRIAMSALADFLLLGHQQVGTFSLASDKTSMFTIVFGGFADVLAAEISRQAFSRLLKYNGMKGKAVLRHSDFEKQDVSIYTTAIMNLAKSGVLVPGEPNLDAYVRQLMNLPEVDPEWQKEHERQDAELQQQMADAAAQATAGLKPTKPQVGGKAPPGPVKATGAKINGTGGVAQ